MPLVSIIMNCYNGSVYLREALDSIYNQTFKDFEIIFWDNLSTDDSAQIALSYGEKVCYFRGEGFLSLGAARNKALDKASGKYIAFLDCDDIWVPTKLEKQVKIMEENPSIDFIYTNFFLLEAEKGTSKVMLKGEQPSGEVFAKFLNKFPVGLLTAFIKRDSLKELDHYFDPCLKLTSEYDLFMRLVYRTQAEYISEPLAYYRVHQGMSSIQLRKAWPGELTYVLDKLIKLHENIESELSQEIIHRRKYIDFIKAKNCMLEGDLVIARRFLEACKFENVKYLVLYVATFLPTSIWLSLKPLWARGTFR